VDNPIIVALDGKHYHDTMELVLKLCNHVGMFKVNDLFFDMGLDIVHEIGKYGPVMLDAKLHDIPNTVGNTAKRFTKHPCPSIVTVHASGGPEMIAAAVEHLPGRIAAVTVLTSIKAQLCTQVYSRSVPGEVTELVKMAVKAGASYIVCSAHELSLGVFREDFKEFMGDGYKLKKITPAIRPLWYQEQEDQDADRTMTPVQAMEAGADYLVMGRAILNDPDPVAAAERTLEEIKKG